MKHSKTIYEMTTITIYSPTRVAVHNAPLNKDAKVFRKLGGDYYVELTFSVDKTLALPKGSYIRVSDPTTSSKEKYALKSDATPEPISGVNGYKYVLKFYSRQHDMEACQIKWLAGDIKELSFRVTTSLRGFAQLIADNMNAYLGFPDDSGATGPWSFDGALDDTDMREQSFEGVSCWDAINNIANAFGVEWWVDHGDQLTIHFGKCENNDNATVIREGEIVNRFPAPKRGDDSNYGTRFYIFGGTQNVPEDYRDNNTTSGGTTFHIAEKRIQLCEIYSVGDNVSKTYHPYFDAIKNLPQAEIVEKTIILDDIFPKNETTIRDGYITTVYENIIEGQDPQPVYYIKVDNKPTLLSTLGITFTSGALAGRSFDAAIVEQNNICQIKIIHTTENSGGSSLIAIPNANLAPKAGDKYILTGVELDEDRITAAERELWNKGTELARQRANDTNVYDCTTNPVYCQDPDNDINFDLGDKVVLKGAHFGETGRTSRVQGYDKLLYAPYVATYNIGDNSVYSRTLKAYKDANAPLLNAVATTERKNESLQAQISSSQSDVVLATTIQRISDLEGNDTDTSDKVSVPGAKKYAEEQAQRVEKSFKAITDKIIDGNDNLIGLLFYGGTNFSAINSKKNRLVFFTPSGDFGTRYSDFKDITTIQVEGGGYTTANIVTKDNFTDCKGAVIYIAHDVVTTDISDKLGFVLKTGDWLVATENGWKKINCGTVRSIKGNNNVLSPDTDGQIDLGDVVTSIKSNGKTLNPNANGLIDLGTIGGASDAQIEDINNRIDGLEASISANAASIEDARGYAEEQATDAYNNAKAYVDSEVKNIFNSEASKIVYEVKEYTNEQVAGAKTYTDDEVAKALVTAKGYADTKASQEDIDTAVSDTLTTAKNYTNTRETAIKDAVTKGIPGTENFAMYAGKTFHTLPPTSGIYIYSTPQFDNVYKPTKTPLVSGNYDISVVNITKGDASKYKGAIIYISQNINAGVITDYELYKGDVIMAIGESIDDDNIGWVKINDTIVGAQYILDLMLSDGVYKQFFEELTGVEYANQVVDIRMPEESITKSRTNPLYPNRIYYCYDSLNAKIFTVPALSDYGLIANYDNKWVFRGYANGFSFSNWKTDEEKHIYYLWDNLPHAEGGTFTGYFEITVRRIVKYFTTDNTSYFYLISSTTYGNQYK